METAQYGTTYQSTFDRDGYVVMPGLLSQTDVAEVLAEANRMAAAAATLDRSTTDFNLESATGGFHTQDGTSEGVHGVLRKANNVEKLSPTIAMLVTRPCIRSAASMLLRGRPVTLHNAILWYKPARVGSAKPLHQDAPYLSGPLDDYATFWFALDRADRTNGCLEFVRGSHKEGPLPASGPERLVDGSALAKERDACVLECGEAVVFHSCVLHSSAPNQSDRPRRALMLRFRTIDA